MVRLNFFFNFFIFYYFIFFLFISLFLFKKKNHICILIFFLSSIKLFNRSKSFPLDSGGPLSIEIKSYKEPDKNNSLSSSYGFFQSNLLGSKYNHSYTLGVLSTRAEFPFQRTKIVMVVDQFVVVNSVGQSIEIRQFNSEDITIINYKVIDYYYSFFFFSFKLEN